MKKQYEKHSIHEYKLMDLFHCQKKEVVQKLKKIVIDDLGWHETILSMDTINTLANKAFIDIDGLTSIELSYENTIILQRETFITIIFIKDKEFYHAIIDLNTERPCIIAKRTNNEIYVYDLIENKWRIEGNIDIEVTVTKG